LVRDRRRPGNQRTQGALTVPGICAILQFLWMLFAKERNPGIARFRTGESDERPFP